MTLIYVLVCFVVIPCLIATYLYIQYRAYEARQNTVKELRDLNKNIKTLIAIQNK